MNQAVENSKANAIHSTRVKSEEILAIYADQNGALMNKNRRLLGIEPASLKLGRQYLKYANIRSDSFKSILEAQRTADQTDNEFLVDSGTRSTLRIGATMPNYDLITTKGIFRFHEFLNDEEKPWTIFFSHPADYTPTCTTELGQAHQSSTAFDKMGCKLIGLSCDSIEDHHGWSKDVLARIKSDDDALAFPIIEDQSHKIVNELGMVDPEELDSEGKPLPARVLVILHKTTVKLTMLYPASCGRNFDEIFRCLTSLQMTVNNGLATPSNWKYGERVIVTAGVKDVDAKKFEGYEMEEMTSRKEYLRTADCLESGKKCPY